MAATLKDYWNTGDDSWNYIRYYPSDEDSQFLGQSFTAGSNYSLSSIKVLIYRTSTPGTLTLNLYTADGDGLPTGDSLASGTTSGDTLTTDTAGEWREITLVSPYSVTSGTKYVITLSNAVVSSGSKTVRWRMDTSAGYSDGGSSLWNEAVNWIVYFDDYDFMFETWGTLTFSPPADRVTYKRLVAAAANKLWYEAI